MTAADYQALAGYHRNMALAQFELAKQCAPEGAERFRNSGAIHEMWRAALEAEAERREGKGPSREPTDRELQNIAGMLAESTRLEKLTARELIDECLASKAGVADSLLGVELMNRVLPNWEDAEEGAKGGHP